MVFLPEVRPTKLPLLLYLHGAGEMRGELHDIISEVLAVSVVSGCLGFLKFQTLKIRKKKLFGKGQKIDRQPIHNRTIVSPKAALEAAEGATGTPPVELSFGRAPKTLSERHHLSP